MDKKRETSNSLEWHAHNFIAVWYSPTIHRSETRKKRIVSPYYKIPCRTDLKHLDPVHSLFPTRARAILELLITICRAQMHLSVFNQHSKIKKKFTWNLEIHYSWSSSIVLFMFLFKPNSSLQCSPNIKLYCNKNLKIIRNELFTTAEARK